MMSLIPRQTIARSGNLRGEQRQAEWHALKHPSVVILDLSTLNVLLVQSN